MEVKQDMAMSLFAVSIPSKFGVPNRSRLPTNRFESKTLCQDVRVDVVDESVDNLAAGYLGFGQPGTFPAEMNRDHESKRDLQEGKNFWMDAIIIKINIITYTV